MWQEDKINNNEVISFLKKSEPLTIAISNFFLKKNIILRNKHKLLVLRRNSTIYGVTLIEHSGEIHLYCKLKVQTPEIEALAHRLKMLPIKVTSIAGPEFFVNQLVFFLEKKEYLELEYFYMAKKIQKENISAPHIHLAEKKDIRGLAPLQSAYLTEEVFTEPTQVSSRYVEKMLEYIIMHQRMFFYHSDSKIVSKANTNAQGFESIQLGGIYTVPEYRQRGLAQITIKTLIN
ncbi:MAG: hypothetical protein JXR63_07690, partial [Spirochaetales bacterium]|nr:hypothetical protein [Spirochaetales bacterium]